MNILYGDNIFSDVTFVVEGKEIRAHKCILAAKSIFFKTMFLSEVLPKGSHKPNVFEIKDISYPIFSDVIKVIYDKDIEMTIETISEFSNIAEMYVLETLKLRCILFLDNTEIDIDDFLEIFVYIKHIPFLLNYCTSYITKRWRDVIECEKFYTIIKNDTHITKEILHAITKIKFVASDVDMTDRVDIIKILRQVISDSN